MFFLPFFEDPVRAAARRKREKEYRESRLNEAVPWDEKIKWATTLIIKADTYKPEGLFEGLRPLENPHTVWSCEKDQCQDSPSGQFRYTHVVIPRLSPLHTWYGNRKGEVWFDGDILIPTLHEKGHTDFMYRDPTPWMSLTPAEIMSMRGGTRLAKGVTVIAGLGLGHQLTQVCKRKKVTKVILVEKSQELVDWLLPVLKPKLNGKDLEVIVGDAMQVVPRLDADVALIDIFEGYGSNDYEVDKLRMTSFGIKKIWGWGTAQISDGW